MLELGVIADDLTGGMMVASLLEREGIRCPLVTSVEALAELEEDAEAVVIGLKIRLAPPEEAVAYVRRSGEALLSKGAKRIYYKYSALFASTEKGNIGPVSEALMALTGVDKVLFCPTWRGTTVYLGRLFVNNVMLHESGASRDPATPMTNSNLVEVLQEQSQVKTGFLPLRILHSAKPAAEEYLAEQVNNGIKFFIVDAIETGDVARIAELTIDSPVTTGADMLPIYLARNWRQGQQKTKPLTLLPPAPGYAAVMAGSCSPKTNRQLRVFEQHHALYRVDLLQAARDLNMIDCIANWAADRLKDGPVGIATTTDVEGVKRAQRVLGRDGAAQLADNLMGGISRRLHELGVRKFVVAGGETSGKVINSLGINRLQVSAFDYLSGGYCHASGTDPISLVTKAGGAGEENFFIAALARMQAADAVTLDH